MTNVLKNKAIEGNSKLKNVEEQAKKNFEVLAIDGFPTTQEINEAEIKAEAVFNAIKVLLPEELHSILANLDGLYGQRQYYATEAMYIQGYKDGLKASK